MTHTGTPVVGDTAIRVRQTVDGMWDWKVETFTGQWQQTEWGYEEPSRDAAIAAARWHTDPPDWPTE